MFLRCDHQSGFGLPMAVFIITVLAFIAVAINQMGENNAEITGVNVLSMRAFYAAESGANIALSLLFPPTGSASSCTAALLNNFSFPQAGLSQCRVTVDCVLNSSLYELTSTGSCGSGSETATRIIQVVAE